MWRILRQLWGVSSQPCPCLSSTHGHAPGQCPNHATRRRYRCANCFERAADEFQDIH